MQCRVDHHRSLVWIIVRDLFVHIEQVTVFLLNDLFTQAIDRVGEIQEYGQARAVGGTAVVLDKGEDVNAVIRRTYPDAMRIASVLPDISCATFNPDMVDDPKELDGTEVAVVRGEIGVAENGAIWIPQQVKYKAIYFISESLVILIDRNKIVDTMYDAYCQLDGQEYQFGTFISGPSKTADIEQALVMGAHGAREVLVILT